MKFRKANLKKIILTALSLILCLSLLSMTVIFGGCEQDSDNKVEYVYVIGGSSSNSDSSETSNDTNVTGLVIPLSDFTTTAKFYGIEVEGTYMEIVAVKYNNSYRTAFNTCQVCYDSGNGYFKQSGNYLVCQNCFNKFSMSQVGVALGGCNPYPILESYRVQTSDSIIISDSYLITCKTLFKNWSGNY